MKVKRTLSNWLGGVPCCRGSVGLVAPALGSSRIIRPESTPWPVGIRAGGKGLSRPEPQPGFISRNAMSSAGLEGCDVAARSKLTAGRTAASRQNANFCRRPEARQVFKL